MLPTIISEDKEAPLPLFKVKLLYVNPEGMDCASDPLNSTVDPVVVNAPAPGVKVPAILTVPPFGKTLFPPVVLRLA